MDELPQLLNILKGEMSLIGPRPERVELASLYSSELPWGYHLRHIVRPGITGWAQVNYPYGAGAKDAQNRLAYDLYYIKNFSLFLDMQIFLKTIRVVLLSKGSR
jgi:lipopolysaccharide/colanic/teichoic acid biosynthesis glycosyltransferase